MSDLTNKVTAQEEETKRLNVEHSTAVLLAPAKWTELKCRFQEECLGISKGSLSFECHEPNADTFRVCRIVRGTSVTAIEFIFHPSIPAISFVRQLAAQRQDRHGVLNFTLVGQTLIFSSGNSGVVLDEFVTALMMPLVR